MKAKISKSKTLFETYRWRNGVSTCPYCKKEPPNEYEDWYKQKYIRYVYLRPDHINWRSGAFAVFSECYRCHKISWLHFDFDHHLEPYRQDQKWAAKTKAAIVAERTLRIHEALDDWNKMLCPQCEHITDVNWQHLYGCIQCNVGGSCDKEKCKKFKKRSVNHAEV